MAKKAIRIGSGLLLDSYDTAQKSGFTSNGIVNSFRVWGFPSTRHVTLALTVYNLPKNGFTLTYALKRKGAKRAQAATEFEVECTEVACTSLVVPIDITFEKEGDYDLIVSVKGKTTSLNLPFIVQEEEWPALEQYAETYHNLDETKRPTIHASLSCTSCGERYDHYVYLGDERDNLPPFPEEGVFECGQCGDPVHTKDLEGRLRTGLERTINIIAPKAA